MLVSLKLCRLVGVTGSNMASLFQFVDIIFVFLAGLHICIKRSFVYHANTGPVRMDFDWHYNTMARDELKSDILYVASSLRWPSNLKLLLSSSIFRSLLGTDNSLTASQLDLEVLTFS